MSHKLYVGGTRISQKEETQESNTPFERIREGDLAKGHSFGGAEAQRRRVGAAHGDCPGAAKAAGQGGPGCACARASGAFLGVGGVEGWRGGEGLEVGLGVWGWGLGLEGGWGWRVVGVWLWLGAVWEKMWGCRRVWKGLEGFDRVWERLWGSYFRFILLIFHRVLQQK